MEVISPQISGRRIAGTLKLQPSALGTETAARSQSARATVRLTDKWEIVEASWAAMTERTGGGCAPHAVDPPQHSVIGAPTSRTGEDIV